MVKGRQGERVRLYVRGTILGYKRSKSNQYPNTSLIQIEGVNTKEEVTWYQGKRMAYIYKAKVKRDGTHYRCIWGKVIRPHGNSGVVRAKFKSNLPPKSMLVEKVQSVSDDFRSSRLCHSSRASSEMVKGRQGERVRLYVRGTILGYKRSKSNQYPNTSLIQIEGVNTKEEVTWYQGKRMAYSYKAKVKRDGTHYRCIWGKVIRPHGNSGVVRAKFKSNLPPKSMFVKKVQSVSDDFRRLYVRGTILGYKRSKSNQYPNTSLIQIEGVNTKEEVTWYQGKRMAYSYKAKVKRDGTHYRCIWGKVIRPHGNSGVVRAKFKSNLPPKSMV
ncbi:hypothetical protein RHMOL_Rhmol09G0232100 [Rhododendron molle]|uniref:Uncharacterized protein n=1 Tax=Rhododendron molle TaxID=49168 RepID=A0ACC0MGS6_RHOML|nr:hypothetical protein RHMOL_Rhmol09G0232100 [Rhododendron molle]